MQLSLPTLLQNRKLATLLVFAAFLNEMHPFIRQIRESRYDRTKDANKFTSAKIGSSPIEAPAIASSSSCCSSKLLPLAASVLRLCLQGEYILFLLLCTHLDPLDPSTTIVWRFPGDVGTDGRITSGIFQLGDLKKMLLPQCSRSVTCSF